jgi:hypothetical protein
MPKAANFLSNIFLVMEAVCSPPASACFKVARCYIAFLFAIIHDWTCCGCTRTLNITSRGGAHFNVASCRRHPLGRCLRRCNMCVCLYVCMYVCMYVCLCVYVFIHVYIYIRVYVPIYVYMHACMIDNLGKRKGYEDNIKLILRKKIVRIRNGLNWLKIRSNRRL